eukprot:gene9-biopygen499
MVNEGQILYNCLVNWEELKAYYAAAEHASSQDARYKACTILEMLNDPVNLLYFHFVSNLVTEFENVNAFYQATDADPEEMQKELSLHYKTLRSRICDVHGNLLPLNKVQFGGKFLHDCQSFISKQGNTALAQEKITEVQQRCLPFLIEATEQVDERLPSSLDLFKGMSLLHPRKISNAKSRSPLHELPFVSLQQDKEVAIEDQYRKIVLRN